MRKVVSNSVLQKALRCLFAGCLLLGPGQTTELYAQVNISGKPGLLYIPTAKTLSDGLFHAGVGYNPVKYAFRFNPAIDPRITTRNSENIYFVNLVLLPRLELNINLLRPNGHIQDGAKGIGDRQIDVKYGILTEKGNRPAVAVILSVPFGIDNSLITNVVVATKTVRLSPMLTAEITGGMASPFYVDREETRNDQNSTLFSGFVFRDKRDKAVRYLSGPIAGVKLSIGQKGGVMAEWDSQHLNVGAYTTLFNHWTVQGGVLNFDQITVGTSYAFSLLRSPKRLPAPHEIK